MQTRTRAVFKLSHSSKNIFVISYAELKAKPQQYGQFRGQVSILVNKFSFAGGPLQELWLKLKEIRGKILRFSDHLPFECPRVFVNEMVKFENRYIRKIVNQKQGSLGRINGRI